MYRNGRVGDARRQIGELIDHRAAPGEVAFIEGSTDRHLTWADVARRATGWREAQPVLGRRPGGCAGTVAERSGRVGLLISDPLEMAAAFLSALAAGVTVAPLNAGSATAELVTARETLGLTAIAGGRVDLDRHGPALQGAGADVWLTGDPGASLRGRGRRAALTAPGGDAGVLLSSSGTTGIPKLIPLGVGQLLQTARGVVAHHCLEPEDRGYSPLPLSHINGLVVGVLGALVGGHRLVLDRRFSASTFWDVVERHGVTWLNLVPAVIAVLASRPAPERHRTAEVAFARSASAPLAVATLERFERSIGVPVLETYGMTEAGSQITANPRAAGARRPGSVGVPVDVELRIVDDAGKVATGTVGRVEIRGDRVVSEYWAPAGTVPAGRPARGHDGWLATGDLGCVDPDGFVHLVGRDDDVINRGGEKLYPLEVEEVLCAEAGVAAAAVVGRPDPVAGELPVAFIVPTAGTDGDALVGRLARRCHEELSRFRRPADFVVVEALPCGTNGKVLRTELRRQVRDGLAAPYGLPTILRPER